MDPPSPQSSVLSSNNKKQESKVTADKQMKQCYLREQIINKNYQPEQFVSYMNEQLGINSNIDQCSMRQLERIVVQFKKIKSNNLNNSQFIHPQRSQQYEQDNQTMICETISLVQQLQPKLIVISDNPKIKEQQFQNQVKCVKAYLKIDPSKHPIFCEVYQPERIQSNGVMGLGATSYLCFKVSAAGLVKGHVIRRYSDFIWLRNMLLKFHPTQIIPPIPNKKASKRTLRQILKRMRILTLFLNDLTKNHIIVNDKYVEGFLTMKDDKKFQKLKEQGQNRKTFESMLSTETISGYVSQQLSEKTLKYKDGLSKFVTDVEVIYKQVTRKCKILRKLNSEKINTLLEIGNKFIDLHHVSSKFNGFIKTQGMVKLTQIYAVLNNMMADWGNSLKKQMDEIQKNLCIFFKYMREQFIGVKQLITRQQKVQMQFIRQKEFIDKQKDKIFNLHDINKWGVQKTQLKFIPKSAIYDRLQAYKIMLPKQSVKVNELKQQMAYYLSELYNNGNKFCVRGADKFCENFSEFVIKAKVNNQQIGAMWAEMSAKFSDPYKKIQQIRKIQSLMDSLQMSEMNESQMYQ